jgi:hypothetical protein
MIPERRGRFFITVAGLQPKQSANKRQAYIYGKEAMDRP